MSLVKPKQTLAIVAITLASCSSQLLPAATPTVPIPPLRVYASAPVSELVSSLTTTYSQFNPGIHFEVIADDDPLTHATLVADPTSYRFTSYLEPLLDVWAAPIGQDGIALIVNSDNGVSQLSQAQVRAIYTGEIDRWNQIGGANLPLIPFTRENGASLQMAFSAQLLGSRTMTSNARIAPSDGAMRFAVTRTPGAIGYIPISALNSSVQAVTFEGVAATLNSVSELRYPLRTILYIVGAREPFPDDPLGQHYRAFFGWIQSPEGQAIIAQHAVPLLRP